MPSPRVLWIPKGICSANLRWLSILALTKFSVSFMNSLPRLFFPPLTNPNVQQSSFDSNYCILVVGLKLEARRQVSFSKQSSSLSWIIAIVSSLLCHFQSCFSPNYPLHCSQRHLLKCKEDYVSHLCPQTFEFPSRLWGRPLRLCIIPESLC